MVGPTRLVQQIAALVLVPHVFAATCKGTLELNATAEKQFLATPNYAESNYPPLLNCSFVIKAPDKHRILIEIIDLETEPKIFTDCMDYVAITDEDPVSNRTSSQLFCEKTDHRQVITNFSIVTISFRSDDAFEYRGAKLSHQFIAPNSCPPGWTKTRSSSCVKLEMNNPETWVEAQNRCNEQKSNLLLIRTKEEYSEFQGWYGRMPVPMWIGYHDAVTENKVAALDQHSQLYLYNEKPDNVVNNNDENDCIATSFKDTDPFIADLCSAQHFYICEMSMNGTTKLFPPPVEIIREGARSKSSQYALWLLIFLIILLLLIIMTFLCYVCWKQKENSRVHAAESSVPDGQHATQNRQSGEQHVQAVPVPRTGPPTAVPTVPAIPAPRVHTPPRRLGTLVPAARISEESAADVTSPRAPSQTNMHEEQLLDRPSSAPRERDKEPRPNFPLPPPRSLPPLPVRESTFHSINTREESFLRSRRANELFDRPKMNVLDNVSAISLDEFWSNSNNKS